MLVYAALPREDGYTFDVPLIPVAGEKLGTNGRDGWYGINIEQDGGNGPEEDSEDGSHLAEEPAVVVL